MTITKNKMEKHSKNLCEGKKGAEETTCGEKIHLGKENKISIVLVINVNEKIKSDVNSKK